MAYKTEDLVQRALEAITKYKLIFMDEIPVAMGISKQTLYNHNLDKMDEVKDALVTNRIQIRIGQRKKWYDSENASLQIALRKLIGTEDEVHRLNGSRQEIKQETTYKHEPVQMTAEEAKKYLDSADIA